jgi:hypothetical protein
MKIFKTIVSTIMAFMIFLSIMPVTSYAIEKSVTEQIDEYRVDAYDIELSVPDLITDGCTGTFYYDETTDSIAVYTGDDFGSLNIEALGTLSVHLVFSMTHNRYYLSWEIYYPQITYFSADLYCRDTSWFFPTYYDESSVSQPYSGAYNHEYGATYSYFSIPSNVDTVRVGWKNAYISSFSGSFAVANGSSLVDPEDVLP